MERGKENTEFLLPAPTPEKLDDAKERRRKKD